MVQGSLYHRRSVFTSWLAAMILCVGLGATIIVVNPDVWHWFVIPVVLSGVMTAEQALRYLPGRTDSLDPPSLFGIFGFHFFFLAYLLHPYWNYYWHYPYPPPDWRPWLGLVAIMNCAGLVAYRLTLNLLRRKTNSRPYRTVWLIRHRRFCILLGTALFICACLQIEIFSRVGGLEGVLGLRLLRQLGVDPFSGMGWMLAISESFPILLVFGTVAYLQRRNRRPSWAVLVCFLAAVFILSFAFGGLRGSRSNIFFLLFWTVGTIHLCIRPVSKKMVLVALPLLFSFMLTYLYYKHGGIEAVMKFGDAGTLEEIEQRMNLGSAFRFVLLHDFARADSQALVLYLLHQTPEYPYAHGRTFLAGLASLVPRMLWPGRPPSIHVEKVKLMYGEGSTAQVSWVFGISAEAMLNFGAIAALLPFPLFAWIVAQGERALTFLQPEDSRRFLLPLLLLLCFVVPMGETQVILFFLAKNGLLPALVVFLSSVRVQASPRVGPALEGRGA